MKYQRAVNKMKAVDSFAGNNKRFKQRIQKIKKLLKFQELSKK